jgi:hypothetical protein
MIIKKQILVCLSVLATLGSTTAFCTEMSSTGSDQLSSRLLTLDNSRPQISQVLAAEARVSTVRDAMYIKETGLVYVQNLSDFEYLATFTVSNPSLAYRTGVSNFIARYVSQFCRYSRDLDYLPLLEERSTTVQDAIAVKTAGLNAARNIHSFLRILPFSANNPSSAYRNAVSNFVAMNINKVLNRGSHIAQILKAEAFTVTVNDAMQVKNAGLIAVGSKSELLDLATYSVPNPSSAYIRAVEGFIRDNIAMYP